MSFEYYEAFSRNLGWVTKEEQTILRGKRVAVAGLGGVGAIHMISLAHLGIGAFHIADMDIFELANFNRQIGAKVSNLNITKAEVTSTTVQDINPEADIVRFDNGVTEENIDAFLDGVDLYIDGLDIFAQDIRLTLCERALEKGIPIITAGPIGMGTAWVIFVPGGMAFNEYFDVRGKPEIEKTMNFLAGLNPTRLSWKYLVAPEYVDVLEHRVPSTIMGCTLAAGVAGTEALKLLLNRGTIYPAPYYQQFDAYLGNYKRGKLYMGMRNPIAKLKLKMALKRLKKKPGEEKHNLILKFT